MKKLFFSALAAVISLSGCKDNAIEATKEPGQLNLTFDARVKDADFALNTDYTIGTQSFKFSSLRYWVSNVSLVDTKGQEVKIPNSYYLVEETSPVSVQDGAFTYPAKKREEVSIPNVPAGDYKTIKFYIGVDSKYNDNLSLQAGELSQLNGMTNISWMWHTSYIFTALSGTMTNSGSAKAIKAETGLNTNYKAVELTLPNTVNAKAGAVAAVNLKVDIAEILKGIDLVATPTIGAGQASAMTQLTTNYTKAITVVSAK